MIRAHQRAANFPFISVSTRLLHHSRESSGGSGSVGEGGSQGDVHGLQYTDIRLTPSDLLSTLHSGDLITFDYANRRPRLNEEALLELCDAARTGLAEGGMAEKVAEKVTEFLNAAVKDEAWGKATLKLSTLIKTRLDKLLTDLLRPENRAHVWGLSDYSVAEKLQRQWRMRFREQYFDIDQIRYAHLYKKGLLHDVTFDDRETDATQVWRAEASEAPSEGQGNIEAGHHFLWLNLACAHRDGIVDSTVEKPTKGTYHVTTLPLLSGREDVRSPYGIVKYMREGALLDMHLPLLSQVGTQIRILRGYRLKSPLAPRAGIRYDGLYSVRLYSLKHNIQTGLHRVVLTLERVPGQRPLQDILTILRPSQLDDWQTFERFEGEMVRQRRGEQGFLQWKTDKAEERIGLKQWRKALELGAELKYGIRLSQSSGSRLSPSQLKEIPTAGMAH
ncbi:hypothetical protein HIM_08428 [Hirsutella minnesotensis 3608]|uniref:Uncharacterized protein n=1 Tax=Hirsutella minnesotensis 3608 TaxID=1043627 RepID=A0A0F7ZSY3_9HYPO|nr:hypothetical protein HIM_08428 [Hirsutella minnesotensis 3608]